MKKLRLIIACISCRKFVSWTIQIILSIALAAVVFYIVDTKCFSLYEAALGLTSQSVLKQVIHERNQERNRIETLLTKWVYDHSGQISAKVCGEIVQECMKTRKPLLMLSLIAVESEFINTAVSKKGAVGLTQVMFDTHKEALVKSGIAKNKRDLFDVGPSVKAGYFILEMYLHKSNWDVPKALEHYLGGKDGAYLHRILVNLGNIYVLTN